MLPIPNPPDFDGDAIVGAPCFVSVGIANSYPVSNWAGLATSEEPKMLPIPNPPDLDGEATVGAPF